MNVTDVLKYKRTRSLLEAVFKLSHLIILAECAVLYSNSSPLVQCLSSRSTCTLSSRYSP